MKRTRGMSSLAALVLGLVLLLVACGDPPIQTPIPTMAGPTQNTAPRPPLLIQFCNDDTGSFPRQDFGAANQLMASSLQQAVTANQQGITLYATIITHDTFNPDNTLEPAFTVPAFPAYPAQPTPAPTHPAQNPVSDPATATAVTHQTIEGIIAHNQQVAALDQQIKTAQTAVAADTQRLTTWNPPIDATATSILGCFQLAASRFAGKSDKKLVYIASDLENNTDVDKTQSFVTSHALAGTVVHVIFLITGDAQKDQQKRHNWCTYLQSAGAITVLFNDRAASLAASDVFDQDWKAPAQPCE